MSAVNINDVFSSTYNNYKLLVSLTPASGSPSQNLRLRIGGTDNSNANYNFQQLEIVGTARDATRSLTQTSARYMFSSDSSKNTAVIDIFAPFLSEKTMFQSYANYVDATGAYLLTSAFTATTSFTGLTLFPASSTITGSYSVFGYSKG